MSSYHRNATPPPTRQASKSANRSTRTTFMSGSASLDAHCNCTSPCTTMCRFMPHASAANGNASHFASGHRGERAELMRPLRFEPLSQIHGVLRSVGGGWRTRNMNPTTIHHPPSTNRVTDCLTAGKPDTGTSADTARRCRTRRRELRVDAGVELRCQRRRSCHHPQRHVRHIVTNPAAVRESRDVATQHAQRIRRRRRWNRDVEPQHLRGLHLRRLIQSRDALQEDRDQVVARRRRRIDHRRAP